MKDSRVQSPGASKLIKNSKHNLLRRDTETSATHSNYIYLAYIPLFLIKKIILLESCLHLSKTFKCYVTYLKTEL